MCTTLNFLSELGEFGKFISMHLMFYILLELENEADKCNGKR